MHFFRSLGDTPKADSLDKVESLLLGFQGRIRADFHNDCTAFHSQQNPRRSPPALPWLVISCCLDIFHSLWSKKQSQCLLIFVSLTSSNTEHYLRSYLHWHFFFCKISIHFSCLFPDWIFDRDGGISLRSFYISLLWGMANKSLSPFCKPSLHCLTGSPCCAEAFKFATIPCADFVCYILCSWGALWTDFAYASDF